MRSRTLAILALLAGIGALVAGVALAATDHSRRSNRLDLALQRSLETRRENIAQAFETAGTVASSLATNAAFEQWYDTPQSPEARARVTSTLTRIAHLGSGFMESLAFVDASGVEKVRVSHGDVVPTWRLSSTESSEPYFDVALELEVGEVHLSRPFRSPESGRWVMSVATPIPAGSRRAILHAVVRVEAFIGGESGLVPGETLTIGEAGRVVADVGAAALGPRTTANRNHYLGRVLTTSEDDGTVELRGKRARFARVPAAAGNSNHWLVIAAAPSPAPFGPGSFGAWPLALIALGAALVLAAMALVRRARSQAAQRMACSEAARRLAEHQSRTDPLTGLLNRRGFGERLRAELVRASRDGEPPGLLVVDIDRFKDVNDRHGHPTGDAVLVEIGRRLATAGRQYDVVGRWGGEEFVVLVPGAAEPEALRAGAERMRAAVADEPVRVDGLTVPVTVSIGGAIAGPSTATAEGLADVADRAMYAAKRSGRNCVRLAADVDREAAPAHEPESIRIAQALALAAAVREGMPVLHCQQVADLAAGIAEELELPEHLVLRCRLAGWAHDVGKVAIPDAVLGNAGPLDAREQDVLRRHAEIGETIVLRVPALLEIAKAVRHHHERWDGAGFPDGLAGEAIPLEARIVAAADAYTAIAAQRPYRGEGSRDATLAVLREAAGSQLDPAVVEALTRALYRADAAFEASVSSG